MGLQLFFISRLFMVLFSNGFHLNDGNTLLNTFLMSYKAQIYFLFLSCLESLPFPMLELAHISVLNVKVHEGYSSSFT